MVDGFLFLEAASNPSELLLEKIDVPRLSSAAIQNPSASGPTPVLPSYPRTPWFPGPGSDTDCCQLEQT